MLYIRLAAKDVPDVGRKKKKIGFGIAAASAAAFLGLLIILGLVIWKTKGRKKATENAQGGIGIIAFRYADLQHATKNFSEKLGGGGFGSVFKGHLSDSSLALAVKRLDGARQGEKQFRTEVSSVGIIQHINLVKLIGFCCDLRGRQEATRVRVHAKPLP